MKNGLSLLAIISQPLTASAFSSRALPYQSCRPQNTRVEATATSPTTEAKEVVGLNTKIPVSRISVCTGELCQCQGEQYEYTGGAADAAIEELQSLGLPFPVDEVGCMGACGMGTMIAVDYENGDSTMEDGLESTLIELGIQRKTSSHPSVSETGISEMEGVGNINEESSIPNGASTTTFTANIKEKSKSAKPPLLADPRDRMRQEAAEVENPNPWMNMASYIAKKATDKMFGSE
ncbi:hypothetical protein ACHAXR_009861 [Thalassiosira sp. AJA248-18]